MSCSFGPKLFFPSLSLSVETSWAADQKVAGDSMRGPSLLFSISILFLLSLSLFKGQTQSRGYSSSLLSPRSHHLLSCLLHVKGTQRQLLALWVVVVRSFVKPGQLDGV